MQHTVAATLTLLTITQTLTALLADPRFWQAVFAVLAGVFFLPNGVVHSLVQQALQQLEEKARERLPETQYEVLKTLADDAVRYAYQRGSTLTWTNDERRDAALDHLTHTLADHGVTFDATTVLGAIEAAWLAAKPLVYQSELAALKAKTSVRSVQQSSMVPTNPTRAAINGPAPLPSDSATTFTAIVEAQGGALEPAQ